MKKFLALIAAAFLFCACSLKYEDDKILSDETPEFVFKNLVFSRIEGGKVSAKVGASQFEKYKNNSQVYAQDVEFQIVNSDSEVNTSGKCGLLSVNQNTELYQLFDGIELYSSDYNAKLFANYLQWNGRTEQLIGSTRDTVRVEKEDTILFGTGFSASGVSGNYKFRGTVTGELESQ